MSLFLHKENQNILWNILHKSPYFIEFQQKYPNQKQEFFNYAITSIEHQMRYNPSNVEQLTEMNKEALIQIITKLKQVLGYSSVWTQHDIQKEKTMREETNANNYNTYEESYHKLLQAPKPPSLDLNLGIKDDKIGENIEELLKRHTEMRERDIYIPPPSIQLQKEMGVSMNGSAANVPRELQPISSKSSPYELPDSLKPIATKMPSPSGTHTEPHKLKIMEQEEPVMIDTVDDSGSSPDVIDIRQELIGSQTVGEANMVYTPYSQNNKLHVANGSVIKQVRWTE